jgi:UDP-N-acetyl-D-mannosaminuronate dehydrogenase
VVITTDHSSYDWEEVRSKARLLIDTRHVVNSKPVAHTDTPSEASVEHAVPSEDLVGV